MTVRPIEMDLRGTKRLANNVRRFGHQCVPIHRNTAMLADKTDAAIAPNFFAGIRPAVHCDTAGVAVTGAPVFDPKFHRPGRVGIGAPLDNVIVVLPPVEFANVEAVRPGIAIKREHRRRTEIQIPVEPVGQRFFGRKRFRPGNRAAVAPGINLLQPSDAPTANQFAGEPKSAAILAALLRAGLINAGILPNGSQNRLRFANGNGGRFLAIHILAGLDGAHAHHSMPVGGSGNKNSVNIGAFEHLTKIGIRFTHVAPVMLVETLFGPFASVAPDIADGKDLDITAGGVPAGEIGPRPAKQMSPTLSTNANESHRNALARWTHSAATQRRRRHHQRRDSRAPKELPSGEIHRDFSLVWNTNGAVRLNSSQRC